MASIFNPDFLGRYSDLSLAALRVLTGGFLVYGTEDNVRKPERMAEFVHFLEISNFPSPELLAPLSAYAQFICGILLVLGLLTRWAGLVVAFNFVVAIAMVHWTQDFRAWWPAIVLVFLGLHFACRGAGRWSIDRIAFRDR
jgi:putative oxidoreductase